MTQPELVALCLKVAKYKKDNKELMTYLLFEAEDEAGYIKAVNEEVKEIFSEINRWSGYQAKKTVRKGLRIANKYIKYSPASGTDIEILINFCLLLKKAPMIIRNSQTVINIYDRQLVRINKSIAKLHEDLQYDYTQLLEESGLVE